jgi:hypothetical protein
MFLIKKIRWEIHCFADGNFAIYADSSQMESVKVLLMLLEESLPENIESDFLTYRDLLESGISINDLPQELEKYKHRLGLDM